MKRWTKKFCVAGLLGSLVLSAGCADNENMLVIQGVMTADAPECVYTPSANAQVLLNGVLDVGFGGYYDAVLLVSNQLMNTGAKARLRAEASNVSVSNAEVRLLINGDQQMPVYSVPATGFVPVGNGQDSGYGAIAVQVMPGITVPSGTDYVIAEIRLQGRTSGGDDIESNLFRFQIYVVDSSSGHGLVAYTEFDNGVGICNPDTCSSGGGVTTQQCAFGQDGPISCCDCASLPFCRTSP
jgi:hypothetical protein